MVGRIRSRRTSSWRPAARSAGEASGWRASTSPRWNCWPTTAAGSITARPRGPSRSAGPAAGRGSRSARPAPPLGRLLGLHLQGPAPVGRAQPPLVPRLLTSSSTSSGKPWAHSLTCAWTAWSTRPPSRWTTSCSPSRSGRGEQQGQRVGLAPGQCWRGRTARPGGPCRAAPAARRRARRCARRHRAGSGRPTGGRR